MKKRCYIAGKISNLPEDEYRLNFNTGKQEVMKLGLEPVCPIDLPHHHNKSWLSYMREDLMALLGCDYLYALSGWRESKGATIEVELANSLGLIVIEQRTIRIAAGTIEATYKYLTEKGIDLARIRALGSEWADRIVLSDIPNQE